MPVSNCSKANQCRLAGSPLKPNGLQSTVSRHHRLHPRCRRALTIPLKMIFYLTTTTTTPQIYNNDTDISGRNNYMSNAPDSTTQKKKENTYTYKQTLKGLAGSAGRRVEMK